MSTNNAGSADMASLHFTSGMIEVFREHLAAMELRLAELRGASLNWGSHADWPWNGFVLSYATLGGSANWERRVGPAYEAMYSWDVIANLGSDEREARFRTIGNPRYNDRVPGWVTTSFNRIAEAGGPSAVRSQYIACATAEARIAFVRSFPGFGEKYGRNIPMDRYDDLVRDHFALDHRLKTILSDCGHADVSYRRGETILRALAEELDTDAWTLDRVIYGRFDDIRASLASVRNAQA